MHLHNVYFWLKPELDGQAVAAFEQGLARLTEEPAVEFGYFGQPAATERDVVENSYSYGLVLGFEDMAAHDRYQAGQIHLKFLEKHRTKWTRVVVYDIETG